MAKSKIKYQETYRKGTSINELEIQKFINDNINNITMELKKRTIYFDGVESIVVEIKLKEN